MQIACRSSNGKLNFVTLAQAIHQHQQSQWPGPMITFARPIQHTSSHIALQMGANGDGILDSSYEMRLCKSSSSLSLRFDESAIACELNARKQVLLLATSSKCLLGNKFTWVTKVNSDLGAGAIEWRDEKGWK